LALHKRVSFFHPEDGQEKDGKVVIDSFKTTLVKATGRALPGGAVQIHSLRLDPGDKKEHG
jgi:hypothetical protein